MTVGQAGPVDPKTYVLGPGDVLQLELWGRLTRTALFEVSPEGKIFLTGGGPLDVAGHTLEWAQQEAPRWRPRRSAECTPTSVSSVCERSASTLPGS
jgi:hypothetical protein